MDLGKLRVVAGVLVGLVGMQLAACSAKTTVKPDGAAQSVVDVVSSQTGFHPTDVNCPSGVEAKVGQEFDCHFTGPEGKHYTAHMRITKVDGERVDSTSRATQARPGGPSRSAVAASTSRHPAHIRLMMSAAGGMSWIRPATWPVLATLASMSPSK